MAAVYLGWRGVQGVGWVVHHICVNPSEPIKNGYLVRPVNATSLRTEPARVMAAATEDAPVGAAL